MHTATHFADIINPKLCSLEEAVRHRETARILGRRFVITNGCFDLLHPGHLFFLKEAAKQGDLLWVLLNSSESVQALKGPLRPILRDSERAYALASLEFVQGVTLFNTPRITAEIQALQPDIYVKAGDYTLETLNPEERQALEAAHTQIHFLPFLEGFSTTQLIQRIHAAQSC